MIEAQQLKPAPPCLYVPRTDSADHSRRPIVGILQSRHIVLNFPSGHMGSPKNVSRPRRSILQHKTK